MTIAVPYGFSGSGNPSHVQQHSSHCIRPGVEARSCERSRLMDYGETFYAAGNVRITFDWNVRTTMYHQKFLEEKVYDVEAVQCPGEMIMEVKYDAFLPRVIQDLIQMDGVRQQSFSKYGACRNYG